MAHDAAASDPDRGDRESADRGIDRRRAERLGRGRERIETHISWVFLGPEDVFKVKKPVALGFLDFSDREARRRACVAEVELNRRLAPGVYLGVVPVVSTGDGPAFGASEPGTDGAGGVIDWAVHMRRLDDAERADHLLAEDRLRGEALDRLAERLAAFHDAARADDETARFGRAEVVERNVRENFEQTREALPRAIGENAARELEAWQLDFLDRQRARFDARVEAGRARDGHGDLRLEHVYFPASGEAPLVIDCIEFNDRFRFADVAADIAFLAMDLVEHERADLAERFLAAYARAADDFGLYPLIDFYASYRAFVRGKVASFVAADDGLDRGEREAAEAMARRYFLVARSATRRPLRRPALVCVGGWIASGKSTVAARIADHLDAPVLSSDLLRKRRLGVAPETPVHDRPFAGAYSPEANVSLYAELRQRAAEVLASGRPVVLDASFRDRDERTAARRLAARHDVDFHFVECRAAAESCRARLRERARGVTESDGRLEIFDRFVESFDSIDELMPEEHLVLDTDGDPGDVDAALAERFPALPRALG